MNNYILNYPYIFSIIITFLGLFIILYSDNLIKKIIGLNIFQYSIIIFYISIGKIDNGSAPIITRGTTLYNNPLPQVLMLTAIVVGISITAVAFSLIIKIKENLNTISEKEINKILQENDEFK